MLQNFSKQAKGVFHILKKNGLECMQAAWKTAFRWDLASIHVILLLDNLSSSNSIKEIQRQVKIKGHSKRHFAPSYERFSHAPIRNSSCVIVFGL